MNYAYIHVSDLERSGAFYDAVLGSLGWRRHVDEADQVGWGFVRAVFFVSDQAAPQPGFGLLSFPANSIPAVKASFESALEHGGSAESEPGSAPVAGAGKYCCRIKDPDGNLVEIAVAHN